MQKPNRTMLPNNNYAGRKGSFIACPGKMCFNMQQARYSSPLSSNSTYK